MLRLNVFHYLGDGAGTKDGGGMDHEEKFARALFGNPKAHEALQRKNEEKDKIKIGDIPDEFVHETQDYAEVLGVPIGDKLIQNLWVERLWRRSKGLPDVGIEKLIDGLNRA